MKQFTIIPHVPHMITNDSRAADGWLQGHINGRFFEAKVYDEPSEFGINNGRVSKLALGKTIVRNRNKNYLEQCDYYYERGEELNNLTEKELNKIVAWFEQLPKTTDNEVEVI